MRFRMTYYLRLASWWLAALQADGLRVGTFPGLSTSGDPTRVPSGEALELFSGHGAIDAPLWEGVDAEPDPEDVDVWLHMSHGSLMYMWMYLPVMRSLEQGMETIGAVTRIVDSRPSYTKAMLEGVHRATAKGRRPLLMTIGTHWANASTYETLETCRRAGAYLVMYSTEPGDATRVSKVAEQIGAREVWEYSLNNAQRYSVDFQQRVKVRVLPSGYARRMDFNVNLNAPERQEGKVGFLGRWQGRPHNIQTLYTGMFGERFVSTYNAWNGHDVKVFVSRYPLQLNVHQVESCCPRDPAKGTAMEALRMTLLLSNKACVVSTPVPEDERLPWEGIVHFAEANETAVVLERLREDVQGCQERSAKLYKERFDPLRLLRSSGFLSVWQPRNVTALHAALRSIEVA